MMQVADFENALPEALKAYRLPDGILRRAPRQPFLGYSPPSLQTFVATLRQTPEMRGPMSSAARAIKLVDEAKPLDRWIIIEAHVDAKGVPQAMSDQLAGLGFELDGFESFVPEEFDSHYTLKFKADPSDRSRARELLAVAKERAKAARALFLAFPEVEGYIESEVYTSNSRTVWGATSTDFGDLSAFPLAAGSLGSATLSLDAPIGEATISSPEICKKADIHIKMEESGGHSARLGKLVGLFVDAGFYQVTTWSGNKVLTAQFASGARAAQVYRALATYFDRNGGAREMTLEQCYGMWRSRNPDTRRLSPVPPVCLA